MKELYEIENGFSASVLHRFWSTFNIFFLGTESKAFYKSNRRNDYLVDFDFVKLDYFIFLKIFVIFIAVLKFGLNAD
jgi:hypothetical protein